MDIKAVRRESVKKDLDGVVSRINSYLKGKNLGKIKPIVARIGRGRQIPHWFPLLEKEGVLPNLDGKTVGSVVEMLFTADVEAYVLTGPEKTELKINPASGVDVPGLDLGVKSPSENWCTSEPFSNAYERLLGLQYDVVALITNYQSAKQRPPLKLQLIHHGYFLGHQIADKGLCVRAKAIRSHLEDLGETTAKKAIRFLAYANQSDWFCKQIIKTFDVIDKPEALRSSIDRSIKDFDFLISQPDTIVSADYGEKLKLLKSERPLAKAVINLADDWIVEYWKSAAQYPSHADWNRFQVSPLDGRLGVSFALQWRYNFGIFFRGMKDTINNND